MKKIISYFVIFASFISLTACDQFASSEIELAKSDNVNYQESVDQNKNKESEIITENDSDILLEDDIEDVNVQLETELNYEEAETKMVSDDISLNDIENEDVDDTLITDTNLTMYVKKNVNVRKGPSADYNIFGSLKKGEVVNITGTTNNGWYRIDYLSDVAFVNSAFCINEDEYNQLIATEIETSISNDNEKNTEDKNVTESIVADNQDENNISSFQSQVVNLCNQKRLENGLPALNEDVYLDSLAQIRVEETLVLFSHTRPDGSSCFTVLDGVQWNACGENIAAGQITPEQVVDEWMSSEGHRKNILSPDFTKIGIGYKTGGDYGTYWVQIFTN